MDRSAAERYGRNLAALSEFQPGAGREVDAVAIPSAALLTTGRDGSPTFKVPQGDGSLVWLGRSSMPSISSEAIFGGFQSGSSSLILPGVLTGFEMPYLLDRMAAHVALFVWEPTLLNLKLAMHLYDLADFIGAGRLVFLLGGLERLGSNLRGFFQDNPGYELPSTLLPVPQRGGSELVRLQEAWERAAGSVSEVQSSAVVSAVERIAVSSDRDNSKLPRVAVWCTDARLSSIQQYRRIGRALTTLGWPHVLCVPDSPAKCHVSARLWAVSEIGADLVLVLNGAGGEAREALPAHVPLVSWYLPGSTADCGGSFKAIANRRVLVASADLKHALTNAGFDGGDLKYCSPGADVAKGVPSKSHADELATGFQGVVIPYEPPTDDPAQYGLDLASHLSLWRALQEVIGSNVDRFCPDAVDALLVEAQRASGVDLTDPVLRSQFRNWFVTCIAPAGLSSATVASLARRGVGVRVFGETWGAALPDSIERCGPCVEGPALRNWMCDSHAVLIPVDPLPYIETMLDALAVGSRVICRQPAQPIDESFPGLGEIGEYIEFYETMDELFDLLEHRPSQEVMVKRAANVSAKVTADHSIGRRLEWIAELMGVCGPTAPYQSRF